MKKVKINNKKMWESLAKFAPNKESLLWINRCLEYQGYKLNDNFEIVSIEPEPLSPAPQRDNYNEIKQANTDDELTEFDGIISEMLDEYGEDPDRMKDVVIEKYGRKLLSIAEKEIRTKIADSINIQEMQDEYYKNVLKGEVGMDDDAAGHNSLSYRHGVGDTLNKKRKDR